MSNGIYCETLLRMRPLRFGSFWYALTFEREGDSRPPKTFLCRAELARKLEIGDVYLFSAKGRYILCIADDGIPVGHLPLEYFRLWLSFARKPYPAPVEAVVGMLAGEQSPETQTEYIAAHSGELLDSLPRFRYHWRNAE